VLNDNDGSPRRDGFDQSDEIGCLATIHARGWLTEKQHFRKGARSRKVAVPKWSNTGRVLRLKGRGVPRSDGSKGDEYVTLKLMLPQKPDSKLEAFVAGWQAAGGSPRQSMGVL
jgi:DnaJ-class molecular chaperone